MPPCAHSAPSQRAASRSVLRAAPPRAPSRAASGLAHARSAVSAPSSWLAAAGGGVRSGCQRFRCCQPTASASAAATRPQRPVQRERTSIKKGPLLSAGSGQKDAARRGASAELIAASQHRLLFDWGPLRVRSSAPSTKRALAARNRPFAALWRRSQLAALRARAASAAASAGSGAANALQSSRAAPS